MTWSIGRSYRMNHIIFTIDRCMIVLWTMLYVHTLLHVIRSSISYSEVLPRDGCEPALTQMNCENFIKFSDSLSVPMDFRRKRHSRRQLSRATSSSQENRQKRPVSKRCSGKSVLKFHCASIPGHPNRISDISSVISDFCGNIEQRNHLLL